jgi:predicted small secreted protein
MKHLLSFSLLAIVALSLSACHTINGVGQDVSAAGHDVSKAANKVEQKINN